MAPLTSKFAAYKKKIANWLTVYRIFIALPTIIFIALDNQLGVLANFSVGAISISLQISLLIGGFLFFNCSYIRLFRWIFSKKMASSF